MDVRRVRKHRYKHFASPADEKSTQFMKIFFFSFLIASANVLLRSKSIFRHFLAKKKKIINLICLKTWKALRKSSPTVLTRKEGQKIKVTEPANFGMGKRYVVFLVWVGDSVFA